MQFLVLTRRRADSNPPEAFAALYPQEIARTRELYAAGFTRQVWHRADRSGACQLVEAADEATVRSTLASLPFAQAGLLDIEIVALAPYAGFAPEARSDGS